MGAAAACWHRLERRGSDKVPRFVGLEQRAASLLGYWQVWGAGWGVQRVGGGAALWSGAASAVIVRFLSPNSTGVPPPQSGTLCLLPGQSGQAGTCLEVVGTLSGSLQRPLLW